MTKRSLQIRHSAIGGYTIASQFERRARLLASLRRVIDWVVIA